MNNSKFICSSLLLLLINTAFGSPIATNYQSKLQKTNKHQLLMASHLSERLTNQIQGLSSLFYATNHEFYDTPVILTDETGNKITYEEQLENKKNYKISKIGKTQVVAKNIWFISAEGIDPSEDYYEQCLAERPCNKLTQYLVEQMKSYAAKESPLNLWIASGTYALPENPKQHMASMLELYPFIEIKGRTADFKHIPYGDDRPLLKGTLSWNSYAYHGGVYARLERIRMQTNDNPIQVEETYVNVNIHSTDRIYLIDSELQKSNATHGGNLSAERVEVINSTLLSQGSDSVNIQSGDASYVAHSKINVKGSSVWNIKSAQGTIHVFDSSLKATISDCSKRHSGALMISDFFYHMKLSSSHLLIETTPECSGDSVVVGIETYGYPNSFGSSIIIEDSEIEMNSIHSELRAIENIFSQITIAHSKITLESINSSAVAIIGLLSSIEFILQPSDIRLKAPNAYFSNQEVKLLNHSVVPSMCFINNEAPAACSQ